MRERYGNVLRSYYSGKVEIIIEDISESEAEKYLDSDEARHSQFGGDTFDHFVPERWATTYEQ